MSIFYLADVSRMVRWIMDISHYLHQRKQQHQRRTERAEQIKKLTSETAKETENLRSRVQELRSADDPLAELMRTLRPKRSRREH